ncbi:MAG: enzyme repeat protein, partial [Labilithrix sp.]|nr:enzyme repeat protein [Labilithrix sp.]
TGSMVIAGKPGTPDLGYGNAGSVAGPAGVAPVRLVIDRLGRTLALGSRAMPAKAVITRYRADGVLDSSFDNDSVAEIELREGAVDSTPVDVAVGSDGKIFVAGKAGGAVGVTRLTDLGAIDTSFGEKGASFRPAAVGETARRVLALADGSALLGGDSTSSGDMFISKHSTTGGIDSTFGDSGTAWAKNAMPDQLVGMFANAQGRIVLAGNGYHSAVAARFDASGKADPWFGVQGIAVKGNAGTEYDDVDVIDASLAPTGIVAAVGSGFVTYAVQTARVAFDAAGKPSEQAPLFSGAARAIAFDGNKLLILQHTGPLARFDGNALDKSFGNAGVTASAYPNGKAIALSPGRVAILEGDSSGFAVRRFWR